jgi:hypothetical protein
MYKKVLGGNVSIMYFTKNKGIVDEGSHSTGGVSGIRRVRKVSQRTREINGYRGVNRAFILRFQNSGTGQRTTNRGKIRPANRGSISAKMFFPATANPAIEEAGRNLVASIEKMLQEKAGS